MAIYEIVVDFEKFDDVGKPFEYDLTLADNHVLMWGQFVQKFAPSPQGEKRWCAMRFTANAEPTHPLHTEESNKDNWVSHYSLMNSHVLPNVESAFKGTI